MGAVVCCFNVVDKEPKVPQERLLLQANRAQHYQAISRACPGTPTAAGYKEAHHAMDQQSTLCFLPSRQCSFCQLLSSNLLISLLSHQVLSQVICPLVKVLLCQAVLQIAEVALTPMLAKEEPSSPMTMGNCCVAFALLVYPVVAAQAKEFCSMSHSCVPFTPVFQPCMQKTQTSGGATLRGSQSRSIHNWLPALSTN